MRTTLLAFTLFLFFPLIAEAVEIPLPPTLPTQKTPPPQETFVPQNRDEVIVIDASEEKKMLFSVWWKRFTDAISKEMKNNLSAIKLFSKIKNVNEIDAFLSEKKEKEINNVLLYSVLHSPFPFTQKVLPHVKNKDVINQAFLIALSRIDYDSGLTVVDFFKAGADPNTKEYTYKVTPLMLAVTFGDEVAAGTLLDSTKDINALDDIGMTALSYAARYASTPAIVNRLLQAGARIDVKDRRAMTPLQHLRQNVSMPKDEQYQALLNQLGERKYVFDQPQNEEFLEALLQGDFEKSRAFLKTGVNINAKDSSGKTPLGHAVLGKNPIDAVRFLIEEGADVNDVDFNGDTPLIRALKHTKNPELVAFLIKAGANVNTPDSRGLTPLAAAFVYVHKVKTAQQLIDAGALLDVRDENGKTPLDYAREKVLTSGIEEYANLINSLKNKSHKENPLTVSKNFESLLKKGDAKKVVEYIQQNNLDINRRDLKGDTLLFIALQQNPSKDIVQALIKAGANLQLRRTNGQTPLTFSIANNVLPETVLLLIQSGASKTDKDASGKSPLDLLKENSVYSQKDVNEIYSLLNDKKQTEEKTAFMGDFLALVRNGSDDDIKKALASGANPNKQDVNGNTPLLFLLQDPADPKILTRLLSAGADPTLQNNDGFRPLSYALTRQQPENIITILKKALLTEKETQEEAELYIRFYNRVRPSSLVTDFSFVEDVYFLPPKVIEERLANGLNPKIKKGSKKKTSLMTAVTRLNHSLDAVRLLLSAGAPINDADDEGNTALFYAIQSNAPLALIEGLIKNGATVNIFNKQGKTPLAYALNNPQLFDLLIKNGADINARNQDGKTLLENSLNDPNYLKLIKAGADINARDKNGNSILMNEILKPDYSPMTVSLLLQNGANVNLANHNGETPLMKAAVMYKTSVGGKSDLIQELIKAGADVNLYDNDGKTALIKAISQTYNTPVILMLIDAGADLSIRDNSFLTALDYAKNNSALQLEKDYPLILKKFGPDTSVLNQKAFETLKQGDTEQLKSLLEQGASPDAVDEENDTLLIKSVLSKNADIICDMLITAKANLDKQNKDGDTALLKALIYKKNSFAMKLIKAGANVNTFNLKGETPLRRAFLYSRNLPLIQALIDAGANTHSRDAFDKTAIDYAKEAVPVIKADPAYNVLLDSLAKNSKK